MVVPAIIDYALPIMSDATLPTLRSTPSEADPRSTQSSDPDSSESDIFPFLVHSQHSMVNGVPPEVDNEKLARQKRRRTSPEDQTTLEAEYRRNPKPDKPARMEILKKVSLAEKELQVWFQNRRQNSRRKTRPLLPHEIAAFGLGGMVALSSAPASSMAYDVSEGTEPRPCTYTSQMLYASQERCQSSDGSQETQRVPALPIPRQVRKQATDNIDPSASSAQVVKSVADPQLTTDTQSSERLDTPQSLLSSSRLSTSLGYLSNRRNARASSLNAPISSEIPTFIASSNPKHSPPSLCSERISATDSSSPSTSQVRLSLSLDGKAELVSSQVSPPRLKRSRALSSTINQPRPTGLKRCQSDVPLGNVPHKSSSHIPLIPSIPNGRSRDARTWEFCCDTEARDELTTQAENESSGSAVAAISLLRSTSTSNLKSNGSKRNAPAMKPESVVHGKKLKLSRASFSLAKLQGTNKTLLGSPSGDSDKENWLPQEGPGNSQRRNLAVSRPQKHNRRRVLEESKTSLTHASVLGSYRTTHRKSATSEVEIFEDQHEEQEVNPEVDRFMRGEVSPSKKGDLDCIQGLLSLSQGTWR